MSIKHWPEKERPREKLLNSGPQSLSDAELLAVFLRTGIKGKTAVDLGRELISRFGGLKVLLNASETEFCNSPGLGRAKYALLQAVLEMARRHQWQLIDKGNALTSPTAANDYLISQIGHLGHEVFGCVYLDNRHRLLGFEELFRGTIDGASIYPREVVKHCLKHQAAAVIFAHNHPSGECSPSAADREITRKLVEALKLIDIRVLDHIIVGDKACYSFAENGLI
jgi:DNA repair protein RadC